MPESTRSVVLFVLVSISSPDGSSVVVVGDGAVVVGVVVVPPPLICIGLTFVSIAIVLPSNDLMEIL